MADIVFCKKKETDRETFISMRIAHLALSNMYLLT